MKKQLLLLVLLFGATLHATPIKKRLSRVEEGINFLAYDTKQLWHTIAQLNGEVTELERKVYKKLAHYQKAKSMKKKCNKNRFTLDKFIMGDND